MLKFVTAEDMAAVRAQDPLAEHFTWWGDSTSADVAMLAEAVDSARVERDMQAYLQQHPEMLIHHLGGGHGRWVIPQARLGAQHVTDFIIGDADSLGRHWTAVELEGPQRPMLTKAGDPSQFLWHAIRQIIDWRVWIELNRDYAARAPADGGLGLVDVSPDLPGLIIIGRRTSADADRKAFLRALSKQLNIEIHTYDWLVDRAGGQVASMARRRAGRSA
ncbi:MAG: DUF4263 domain-containing protein [Beijerinckiaceae bacterium]|nr:DUF4263 domain-containing protein [Beijerinckiaceae bacterium]